MRFTCDWKQFRPGLRVLKSGLAVFLTLLLFRWFDWEGVQIAALAAVFSLREDFDKSVHFGASRVLGNSIGGAYALLYYLVERLLPQHFLVTLIMVPICVMLTIMTNVAMNNKAGVVGGVSALLIITLSIPSGDSIAYALTRILETFFGVFIAMLVNVDLNGIKKRFFSN